MSSAIVEDIWLDWQTEVAECRDSHIFVSGGLGSGKTNLVPKLAVDKALKFPGSRGVVVADTFDQILKSIDLELAMRLNHLKLRYHAGGKERPYTLSNGSQIWYDSFQKQPADFKGPEWDWGIFDEADNKDATREKYEMIDGRIGRNRRNGGDAQLFAFMNPVSHGHWAYQDARELALPGYRLFEISTYRNRRFLREGYIEKQEIKYPPGTPGHDRFILGKCGIPHPLAVFKRFKYERDRSELQDIGAELQGSGRHAPLVIPRAVAFRSAMHLHDGQPTGWLRVALLDDGTMVPVRGLLFHAESPARIAERIREIIADTPLEREHKPILADPGHEMFRLLRRAGLRLARAQTDVSLGIGLLRNRIDQGKLKLLRLPDKRCATPDLLIDLEEHKFSDKGELEEERWSHVRPLELICAAHRVTGRARQYAESQLANTLRGEGRGFNVDKPLILR